MRVILWSKRKRPFLSGWLSLNTRRERADTVPANGVEELTGPRQDAGSAATTSTSNGKRKSVSEDMLDGFDSGEPSRKRRLSETQIAPDVDGDSLNIQAQPSSWNADLSI